jgi:predicted permease
MRILGELRSRWRSIIRRARFERDLDAELSDHIAREVEARIGRGRSAEDARRTALRDFGSVAGHKDECRRSVGVQLWDDLCADLRYAVRSLCREPGFSAVVILTLALGLGANMTIFSAIDAVLLRPLPYADQEALLELHQSSVTRPDQNGDVAPANFLDWRERTGDVLTMGAVEPYSRTYSASRGPVRIPSWLVSEGFFEILGTPPLLGRTFLPDEFTAGRSRVLVLGYGFWSREFGRDPAVVGRTLIMDKEPFTIVGVMPAEFEFPRGRDLWSPKVVTADDVAQRSAAYFRVVARLRPGVTAAAARTRLDMVARQLRAEYPRDNRDVGIAAVPLKDAIVGGARPVLAVFVVGVVLLLVVACVNVSNLVIVRLLGRDQEFGVRLALGAGSGRLRRQVLAETLVTALIGAVAAALVARWSTSLLRTAVPATLPRAELMAVGWPVVAAGFLLAFATAAAVSLIATASGGDAALALRLTRQSSGAGRRRGVQRSFVAAELAVAVILLVTAGLLVRSLTTLLSEHRGFRTENVAAAVVFAWQEYPSPAQRAAFTRDVVFRLLDLPDVDHAGVGSALPLAERIGPEAAMVNPLIEPGTSARSVTAQGSIISPGYFEALGIALHEGRRFEWTDDSRSKQVVVVNERLARQYWPGRSPLGERISVRLAGSPVVREVVGVVADVRRELGQPIAPALYIPHAQSPTGSVAFVVHTNGDVLTLLPMMRREIASANASMAVSSLVTLDDLLQSRVSARTFNLGLVGFFAAAVLLLATVGAYGAMAYAVRQRRAEIVIRLALGAAPRHVIGVLLADGMKTAAAGVGVGLVLAIGMSRLARGLLYGIQPIDPPSYATAALVVMAIAILAAGLPALRAARVDALRVLRGD